MKNAEIKPQKYKASTSFTSTGIYTVFLQQCSAVKIAVLQIPGKKVSKEATVEVHKGKSKLTLFSKKHVLYYLSADSALSRTLHVF